MAEITETGATGTSLAEYKQLIEDGHLAIDPAWNIEPESPDGLRIAMEAELLANLDEQVVMSYLSADPGSAIGQQLNRIAAFCGLTRQAATPSTSTVTFTGVNGTQIPAGTKVRNSETDTLWLTDSAVTISGGTADVGVTCETPGAESAGIGDLSAMASSVGGVTGVSNAAPAIIGREEETDAQFRNRRSLSVSKPGNNQVDSIYAQIADVDGVSRLKIYENYEAVTDSDGILKNSICIFVQGGDDTEIGNAIAAQKAPGCGLNATNTFPNKVQLTASTPKGNPLDVTFYRPEVVTAFLEIVLGSGTPDGLEEQIKEAVIEYANATLFNTDVESFDNTGFTIGEEVPVGKLYTPVNSVVGSLGYVDSILIGTSPSDISYQSVDPGVNGIVVFDADNITVSVNT